MIFLINLIRLYNRSNIIEARLCDEGRRFSFNLATLAHNHPGAQKYVAKDGSQCVVVSFDHCAELGQDFGEKWSLTITSKPPFKIHHLSTESSTEFAPIIAAFKVLGKTWHTQGVNPKMKIAICLDNLTHSGESDQTTMMIEALHPWAQVCLQDLFHVTKKSEDGLKNTHELCKTGVVSGFVQPFRQP